MSQKQLRVLDVCRCGDLPQDVMDRLPKVLIIGVAKGGTTSMFDNLATHSRIIKPKPTTVTNDKELRFFWKSSFYKRGAKFYADFFPEINPGAMPMEGTTAYVWIPCQERIAALLPDVKAILMLRNPADRAWSHYWTFFSKPPHNDPISCLDDTEHQVVQRGFYLYQIKRWHEHFPKENLLILRAEDYFNDECATLREVYSFLNIDEEYPIDISRRDPWAETKEKWGYPAIPAPIKRRLDEIYRPHNEKLSEYLGEDWTWQST